MRLTSWAWIWQACYYPWICIPSISPPPSFPVLKILPKTLLQGLKFRFNPAFNEGDEVLLDGEQSTNCKNWIA